MKTALVVSLLVLLRQMPPSKVALERECKEVPVASIDAVRTAAETTAKAGATPGAVTFTSDLAASHVRHR